MKYAQKDRVHFGVDYATKHIQEIEEGADDLYQKVDRIEHQLVMLLDDVIEALPQTLRKQARECFQTRERLRESIMEKVRTENAAWEAQKKARSESLVTANEL